tara:strand:- start:9801 stop:10511 length:711 start_codon:yes stop_codon:yes gene_type:complete
MSFEDITVLVPTYNRGKFLSLFLMGMKCQTYPHDKITIIIDDDGPDKFIQDIELVRQHMLPMKITYITDKPRRSIGKKRNDLIKEAQTKIFAFVDDDDIYFPSYLQYSYETLKSQKVGCVGSDKMLFCMSDRDFSIHGINCGDNKIMIHEATMMMTKKFYRSSVGFGDHSHGEGKELFTGNTKNVAITEINGLMCCLQHGGNTIDKLRFANDDNKVDIQITDEMKDMLQNILNNTI